MEANFKNPPDSAKPRVWWHWMNGNVTKDGIQKDLAWMNRTGIGGFQNFDAGLATPQIVEKRLIFMTPEWQDWKWPLPDRPAGAKAGAHGCLLPKG